MVVNCERVWKEISNYLERDLGAELRTAMDEHFRLCQRCASVLAGTRNVIQLYSDDRMIEVPVGFGRRLERRLAQQACLGAHCGWITLGQLAYRYTSPAFRARASRA